MSREIKFRAWDKDRKEYLSAGNVLLAINSGSNPKETTQYLDELRYPNMYKERFIIEQYTGLHDKNGKEIYEGDIVKRHFYADYDCCFYVSEIVGAVIYEDCCFLVEHFDKKDKDVKYVTPFFIELSEYPETIKHYEVIGNIYENSELLEDKIC